MDAETFWGLVRARADLTPDATLLVDAAAGYRLSCAEFASRCEVVAAGLVELGVAPGTPVSWQLPTRVDTVVLSAALARIGAVQNPIIHIYRDKEVGFALRETGCELFVVPEAWRGTDFPAMAQRASAGLLSPPRILVLGALPEGDPATLPPPPDSGGPVRWIYYTSGTTSDPKGVRHRDRALLAAGRGLASALGVGPDDLGSVAFPFAHIGGPDYLVMMLCAGFGAVLFETFDAVSAVEVFRREGVTVAGGSTAFYSALLAVQRAAPAGSGPVAPSLRMLAGGGAPKPPELFTEVVEQMGVPIAHGYGMTEIPMITQGSPEDTDEALAHSEGAPLPGVEVRVVTADGNVAPTGVEGEVRVRGATVFAGYTDPAATAEAFDADGWFRTGDLGVLRGDGHLTLTGRLKDVIIRKGENVSAREIEDLLFRHPKVAAVAVVGLPDPARGERVCAVVEPAGPDLPTLAELVAFLRAEGLAVQKIPEQLELVQALPRNATMKILKHELRARFGAPGPHTIGRS